MSLLITGGSGYLASNILFRNRDNKIFAPTTKFKSLLSFELYPITWVSPKWYQDTSRKTNNPKKGEKIHSKILIIINAK